MSTLKADQWLNTNGTENFKCRTWVNFNGTGTLAIRASGNVSSITDTGVGQYTVNFATSFADANYAAVMALHKIAAYTEDIYYATPVTVSSILIITYTTAGIATDTDSASVAIFR